MQTTRPVINRWTKTPLIDRFTAKIDKSPSGCWIWIANLTPAGYGRFSRAPGDNVYAHRMAYELWRSPIEPGLTIDHLCRVRSCVNPDHLEPVTLTENIQRIPYEARVPGWAARYGVTVEEMWERLEKPHRERQERMAEAAARRAAQKLVGNPNKLAGVFRQGNGKWTARGKKNGKRLTFGTYNTPEEAHAAYLAWKATQ